MARSAVSDMYKFTHPGATIGSDPLINATMKTITKIAPEPVSREPLKPQHFQAIFRVIDLNSFRDVRDYHLMLMMYAMARRNCEAVRLLMQQVHADEENACLIVTHQPAKQRRVMTLTTPISYAPDNPALDVGRWHKLYMTKAVSGATQYFHSVTGEALSADTPRHSFRRLFELAGLSYNGYGGHSARSGGTSAQVDMGGNELQVKTHGTWAGDTYLRYVKPKLQAKLAATQHLNKQN